jgi:hypothetical protein
MTRKPIRHSPANRFPESEEKPHSFLWIGMIVFVATWTFLLGILVGRGTIPVLFEKKKIEGQLAAVFEEALRRKEALLKRYIDAPTPNLAFYDQLKRSDIREPPVSSPRSSTPKTLPTGVPALPTLPPSPAHPNTPTASPPSGMPTQAASAPPAPLQDTTTSPVFPAEPITQPVSAPVVQMTSPPKPAVPEEKITLRANAVPNRRMAEAAVEKLRKKGYDAKLITRMIAGKGVWYEISVGNIPSRSEADALIMGLRQDNLEASVR